MTREVTLGQYYAVDSPAHRLDPRTKLACTFLYIFSLFLFSRPLALLGAAVVLFAAFKLARVPLSFLLKGLRGVWILLLFTLLFRAMLTPGELLWSWWIFSFTREGLLAGIHLGARIGLMIGAATLLSCTATPKEMADGLEKACSFLKRFGVPMNDLALIVMIAFRFIPIMTEEMFGLMEAQAARGMPFEGVSIWRKCRNILALLVPLFVSSLRRASDLAMAMEARGYEGRVETTRMYPLAYQRVDYGVYAFFLVFFLAAILLRIWG